MGRVSRSGGPLVFHVIPFHTCLHLLRHLLREDLDTAAWDAKPRKHAKTMLELQLDPEGVTGNMVQTVNKQKQEWRVKFQVRTNRHTPQTYTYTPTPT